MKPETWDSPSATARMAKGNQIRRPGNDWLTSSRHSRREARVVPEESNATAVQSTPVPADGTSMRPSDVYPRIAKVFDVPEEVYFENGFESEFSRSLTRQILSEGNAAVEAVAYLVTRNQVKRHIAEEALRTLGRIDDSATREYRRWVLDQSLEAADSSIRDAASLAISEMDDPQSIPALRKAIDSETCAELREDLIMVLRQLESHGVPPSKA